MRKIVLVTITLLGMMLATAGMALANAGPHGDFVALEDGCAGCHRAHTATQARLVSGSSIYGLCTSCHDGTGALTNVIDGALLAAYSGGLAGRPRLLGGGFTNVNHYTGGSAAATSKHRTNLSITSSWGGDGEPGTSTAITGLTLGLSCTSCHDPHGSVNYRMLKTTINGFGVSVPAVDEDIAIGSTRYIQEKYGTLVDSGGTSVGISAFCATCHSGYWARDLYSGSMVAFGTKYRHRVDMVWNSVPSTITVGASNPESAGFQGVSVPLAYTYGSTWSGSTTEAHENTGTIATCITCHFAHGTSATMGTNSAAAIQTGAQETSLLRWNNRGVCQACHQKT